MFGYFEKVFWRTFFEKKNVLQKLDGKYLHVFKCGEQNNAPHVIMMTKIWYIEGNCLQAVSSYGSL